MFYKTYFTASYGYGQILNIYRSYQSSIGHVYNFRQLCNLIHATRVKIHIEEDIFMITDGAWDITRVWTENGKSLSIYIETHQFNVEYKIDLL